MRGQPSLERRLALGIGLVVMVLWVAAASVTSGILRREVNSVFDAALAETAQRILPLAAVEILGREEDGVTMRLATTQASGERFTFLVRDGKGRVLFQSFDANLKRFPPPGPKGFRTVGSYRYYDDAVMSGSLSITIAEPLAHRRTVLRSMELVLGLPLVAVIPLSFLGIVLVVRRTVGPLRRLREALMQRGAEDLSPVEPERHMPAEMTPVLAALNGLLDRLRTTFEAERSFAAAAAHELRTPLAGAIAQLQRLQSETADEVARVRGRDAERTLKRLTHISERLMQLARAEGGRLTSEAPSDMRPVLRLVTEDLHRMHPEATLDLSLPRDPVVSDIDADAFGILARNLVENALKHGPAGGTVGIALSPGRVLTVTNDSPAIAPEVLARLTERFERSEDAGEGAGLGLAIVRTIAERSGGEVSLTSPAPGRKTGFQARVVMPPAAATFAGRS